MLSTCKHFSLAVWILSTLSGVRCRRCEGTYGNVVTPSQCAGQHDEFSELRLSCSNHQVLNISSVCYGLLKNGRCIMPTVCCVDQVVDCRVQMNESNRDFRPLKEACHGKPGCIYRAYRQPMNECSSALNGLSSDYLVVWYNCVPMTSTTSNHVITSTPNSEQNTELKFTLKSEAIIYSLIGLLFVVIVVLVVISCKMRSTLRKLASNSVRRLTQRRRHTALCSDAQGSTTLTVTHTDEQQQQLLTEVQQPPDTSSSCNINHNDVSKAIVIDSCDKVCNDADYVNANVARMAKTKTRPAKVINTMITRPKTNI